MTWTNSPGSPPAAEPSLQLTPQVVDRQGGGVDDQRRPGRAADRPRCGRRRCRRRPGGRPPGDGGAGSRYSVAAGPRRRNPEQQADIQRGVGLQLSQLGQQPVGGKAPSPAVDADGDRPARKIVLGQQGRHQGEGQIVDRLVAQILQHGQRRRHAGAGHAGDQRNPPWRPFGIRRIAGGAFVHGRTATGQSPLPRFRAATARRNAAGAEGRNGSSCSSGRRCPR